MNRVVSVDTARAALAYIPSDERDLWLRIGMALKSEFGQEGFALFDEWSKGAPNYKARAVNDSWKSFKAGGGVTIATLIGEAKQRGFDSKHLTPLPALSDAELATRRQQRAEQQQAEEAARAAEQAAAAVKAGELWSAASADGSSPYLTKKAIAGHGVRYQGDTLLLPLVDGQGQLWNVQRIFANGEKRFLRGARVSGCWHLLGTVDEAGWLLLAEGYATAATLHEATGHPVAVAVNATNLPHVARALRQQHPGVRLLLCADDDTETEKTAGRNPGVQAAERAARLVGSHWCKPQGLPAGATDFNDLLLAQGAEVVRAQIAQAVAQSEQSKSPAPAKDKPAADTGSSKASRASAREKASDAASVSRPFFRVDELGVWYHGFNQQGDALPAQWICSPLQVTAKTRDASNGEWGYLLEFSDPDGQPKRWAMPASLLSGDGTQYRSILLSMGLQIGAGTAAKNQLTVYIQTRQTDVRVRCTDRIGWHGDVYVLPDRTLGEGDELVMFQSPSGVVSQFKQAGTLEQWRTDVAALCAGNSRLTFCVSAAFAAPLLHHAGVPSGGFHIWGDSSSGKSTAFKVAGSVYGGRDYPRNWRMTDNALELVAAQHSDALLLLDEIAQVDPKVVGDTVYMLANESGKGRATQNATSRRTHTWRLLFLSDGEVSLANHMSEAGKGTRGGHDVRMAHIPADAGQGLGVYETLHGFADGASLSNHLVNQANRCHGTAGLAFIEWAVAHAEKLSGTLREKVAQLVQQLCPEGAHGQVQRVASRFALVGIAGELATQAGLTGWANGEAVKAARTCFSAYLDARGGIGNSEHDAILRQVSGFFQLHGDARFTWWHRAMDDHKPNTMNRAGFKRLLSRDGEPIKSDSDHHREYGEKMHPVDGEEAQLEYFVLPAVFREEICKGFNPKTVAHLLVDRGMLLPEGAGERMRADRKERLPGMGNTRCYRFGARILSGEMA